MIPRTPKASAVCLALLIAAAAVFPGAAAQGTATLPERLSNAAFWKLSTDLSEPNGFFRSA